MSAALPVIRAVIDRVLWTAGATDENRAMLARAIAQALNSAPPEKTDERAVRLDRETMWKIYGVVKGAGKDELARTISDAISAEVDAYLAKPPSEPEPFDVPAQMAAFEAAMRNSDPARLLGDPDLSTHTLRDGSPCYNDPKAEAAFVGWILAKQHGSAS